MSRLSLGNNLTYSRCIATHQRRSEIVELIIFSGRLDSSSPSLVVNHHWQHREGDKWSLIDELICVFPPPFLPSLLGNVNDARTRRFVTFETPISDRWTISNSNPVRSPFGVNWTFPVMPSKEICYSERVVSHRSTENSTWLNFEWSSIPNGHPRPSAQEIFGRISSTPRRICEAINLS